MARAPDPRAERAEKLFREGKKLVEIAEALDVPEGTVRSWKNRYHWDNATLQKSKRNAAKRKGGQPGNKNAIGNRGGAAPEGNRNAVTTGEFETLLFDCLEPEERILASAVQPDKEQLLLQEIRLLTVREHRMLKRIDLLRTSADGSGKLGQIQNIEDALTRVQARKRAAIDSLHRYGVDDARLKIELKRLGLAARKAGALDEEEEPEDDGFLAALDGAAEDWITESREEMENGEDETAGI